MLHAFIKSKRGVNLYERKRHNNLFPGGSNIPTNNHHIIDAYKIIKGLKQSFFSYIYIGE